MGLENENVFHTANCFCVIIDGFTQNVLGLTVLKVKKGLEI